MTASEATLVIPIWLVALILASIALYGGWPIYVRPRLVHWRKKRRNARRIFGETR